jgi:hypothetical protein
VIAMTDPTRMDEFEDWHFGFFLHQQWARQQGEKVMAELVKIKCYFPISYLKNTCYSVNFPSSSYQHLITATWQMEFLCRNLRFLLQLLA